MAIYRPLSRAVQLHLSPLTCSDLVRKQLVDGPAEARQLTTQANGQAGRGGMAASAAGGAGVGLGPTGSPSNGSAHQPTRPAAAREPAAVVNVATYRNRDNQPVPGAVVKPIQRPELVRSNSLPSGAATQPRALNEAVVARAQVRCLFHCANSCGTTLQVNLPYFIAK